MTLGSRPESLVFVIWRNQSLSDPEAVVIIIIDWETSSAAAVITNEGYEPAWASAWRRRWLSGCGQGTMFGNVMKQLEDYQVPQTKIKQSEIYTALEARLITTTPTKLARSMVVQFAKTIRFYRLLRRC